MKVNLEAKNDDIEDNNPTGNFNLGFKRIEYKPVWGISGFFIKKEFRHKGLSGQLIKGAVDFARRKKIKILESYPAIPYNKNVPHPFLWVGVLSSFIKNGFTIVQQHSKSRAMVRLEL